MVAAGELLETQARLAPWAAAAVAEKLPPPTRAAVIMALVGIALLGMLIVVIVLLGGHWARRQGGYRRGPAVPPDRLPLHPNTPEGHVAVADGDMDKTASTDTLPNSTNDGQTKLL